MAAPDVLGFRDALEKALKTPDPDGRITSLATWGVYAFYDFDEEPIYVGQTNEQLRVRIRRHLTNQRTDAVGMRVLDPYEVRYVEMWPLWDFSDGEKNLSRTEKKKYLDRLERTVYDRAVKASRFGVILNEKIPPERSPIPDEELPKPVKYSVVPEGVLAERRHRDNRIARRAETLGRLANVVRERGSVTTGLRRVVVVQAVRLASLGALRLAEAEGRPAPDLDALINLQGLVAGALGPDTDEEL